MSILITDSGFSPDDWTHGYHSTDALPEVLPVPLALELDNTQDAKALAPLFSDIDLIRVIFPSFADGRGFSLARHLRLLGFDGRLRAFGPVLADQYTMARRAGFDEVEIPDALAQRQSQDQWQARSDWRAHDYQSRLRQFDGL